MHPRALKAGLVALSLATTLGLAGCGGHDSGHDMGTISPTSSAPPAGSASVSAEFNDADVRFVQMMLPHHEQAVAMSDTLLAKDGVAPDVTTLAEQVRVAQQTEIDTMKGLLTAWGQPQTGGMEGMDHGGDDGMATDAELQELTRADATIAQKMYLQLMTAHHQGAISMARSEISDGKNPDAVGLANSIVTTQQHEIGVMKDLLAERQ